MRDTILALALTAPLMLTIAAGYAYVVLRTTQDRLRRRLRLWGAL